MDEDTPLFVNTCIFTQDIYQEYARHSWNGKWHVWVILLLFIPAVLEPRGSMKAWIVGVLGQAAGMLLILGVVIWSSRGSGLHRLVEQSRELNGGRDPETCIRFYDAYFLYENRLSGGVLSFHYEQIGKCEEFGRTIRITLLRGNVLTLDKNGFDGTLADFRSFIEDKCPRIRWKSRQGHPTINKWRKPL